MQTDSLGFQIINQPASASQQSNTTSQKDPLGFQVVGSQGSSSSQSVSSNFSNSSETDPLGFQVVSQPSSVQKTDNSLPANAGVLEKTWHFLNTPLTEDFGAPDSIQGSSGVLGGIERGAYKIANGFTSPLSLILTIGTLGTAGFLESAGANVLKSTLMAGADGLDEVAATAKIAQFEKAAKAATDAMKVTGQPVSKAVVATGMDYNEFRSLGNILYNSGLTEKDVLGGNLVQRGVSSAFRNLGVDAVKAQKIAKGTQWLMDTGFTGQQLSTAIQTVPQVFDALKDGKYDDAAEYATEGVVSGTLGLVGASHAYHSAGEAWSALDPDEINRQRPSDENQKINKLMGKRDGRYQVANQRAENFEKAIRTEMGAKMGFSKIFETPGEAEAFKDKERKMLVAMDTGNDPELARQIGNALTDAIGQPERKLDSPNTTLPHPGLPDNLDELIHNANINDKQKAYISKFVDAYHAVAKGLTDGEQSVYDKLRKQDDQNWNIGNAMGLISTHVDNHIHRVWGDDTNNVGNKLIQQGRTGRLETSVTQARKRVWDSLAEGLLLGRQLKVDDPVAIIGKDHADIYKAAANRSFLDSVRDANVRASDGRPLVVYGGQGHVVQGTNGENAAVFVDKNRVRDVAIADSAVDIMRKTGDLDRFLSNGNIDDVTPRIRPDNVGHYVDIFQQQAQSAPAQYDAEGNNVLRKDIETLKAVQNGTAPASALDAINAKQKARFVWRPQDYVTPKDHALQGWNWMAKTDDGTNVLARSDIKFHPESAQYLINRLGLEKSYLRENKGIGKITGPILKGGKQAKAVLLSFSPFHLQQEALRAIMVGVNPFSADPIGDIASRPILNRGVRQGLTLAPDKAALEEHSVGVAQHSAILSKIPILGKAMDWYQDFLFNRYIPSLKAQAMEVMFDKYKNAHPDWTDDAVAKAAAEHTNNTFGGQNWRAMGRAAATQDWFHIFALAPDWLESEMRFAASTLRGGLGNRNFSREQVLTMAAGLWGAARVSNLVTTGNMHLEAPFGLVTKDKNGREIVHSVRTMPTDILHMASDPAGFIKGRFSPFARLGEEAITGRDTFGRKLAPGDLAIDIFRNMAPIPFQAIGQAVTGNSPNVSSRDQMLKAAGFTGVVYRTEAQKLALKLASQHDESGPLDPAKLQRYEAITKIEDGLRSGSMTPAQLNDARDFGGLSPEEYKRIRENLKLTQGLDPETARMVAKVHRLPAADALQIWDAATPKEKAALAKVLIKKKQSYISRAMKNETPQQRLNDPIFRRLRLMFQEGEPVSENQFPPAIIPQKKYPITAINDQGHRIGSHNGQDWFDHETDEPISA